MYGEISMKEAQLIDLLEYAERAAMGAGAVILKHYGDVDFCLKDDLSPLTRADMQSHKFISKTLSPLGFAINSEESQLEFDARKDLDYFWLIDPLDGTKDFLCRNGQFVVSIALIHRQRPILGVLYAPAFGVLYSAYLGGGAFKNHKKIQHKEIRDSVDSPWIALASVHHSNSKVEEFAKLHGFSIDSVGSALKFGILSENRAQIYPRFEGSSTWDIAAGDIILQESGGIVISIGSGCVPQYNKESHRNDHFIAFSKLLKAQSQTFLHGH